MKNQTLGGRSFEARPGRPDLGRLVNLCCALLLFLTTISSIVWAQNQQQLKLTDSEPSPEPAIPAILAVFDKYEVVATPAAHGIRDVDDFIFALIRNPAFPKKVDDIAVECGNSLYQPVLDRYIAGEDVPFTEGRKVWRNTQVVLENSFRFAGAVLIQPVMFNGGRHLPARCS
jgi:hypothetical protein